MKEDIVNNTNEKERGESDLGYGRQEKNLIHFN